MSVFSYFSPLPVMVSRILLISYGPLHTTATHCTTKSPFFNPIRYSQSAATRSANHRLSLYSPLYCITTFFFIVFRVTLRASPFTARQKGICSFKQPASINAFNASYSLLYIHFIPSALFSSPQLKTVCPSFRGQKSPLAPTASNFLIQELTRESPSPRYHHE